MAELSGRVVGRLCDMTDEEFERFELAETQYGVEAFEAQHKEITNQIAKKLGKDVVQNRKKR